MQPTTLPSYSEFADATNGVVSAEAIKAWHSRFEPLVFQKLSYDRNRPMTVEELKAACQKYGIAQYNHLIDAPLYTLFEREKATALAERERELTLAKSKLTAAETAFNAEKRKAQTAENEKKAVWEELEKLQAATTKTAGSEASVKSELTTTKSENERIKSELHVTKSELTNIKSELNVTKSELTNIKSELNTTKSEKERIKSELTTTKSELTNIKSELNVTKSELTNIKSELNTTKSELTAKSSSELLTESELKEKNALKQELQQCNSEMVSIKSELNVTKAELLRTANELTKKEAEINAFIGGKDVKIIDAVADSSFVFLFFVMSLTFLLYGIFISIYTQQKTLPSDFNFGYMNYILAVGVAIVRQGLRLGLGIASASEFRKGRITEGYIGFAMTLLLSIFESVDGYEMVVSYSGNLSFHMLIQGIIWSGTLAELRIIYNVRKQA